MSPNSQQQPVAFPHFVRRGPRAADFQFDDVLDRLTSEVIRQVRGMAEKRKPFFVYWPLTAPHKPAQPHARFRGTTGLAEYGDFVAQVDASVGQLLQELDNLQIADETLLIYSSDNGSYMYRYDDPTQLDHVDDASVQGYRAEHHRANGPFRGTKADIWEAGHHVPLLVRWPGNTVPGSECREPVCLTDLYATIAEILQLDLGDDEAEDSFSLLNMLRQQPQRRGAPVIHHSARGMFAIRDGRWKLILGNGSGGRERPAGQPFAQPYQLYDLSQDIGEQHDVAAQYPDLVRRLTERAEQIRSDGRSRRID